MGLLKTYLTSSSNTWRVKNKSLFRRVCSTQPNFLLLSSSFQLFVVLFLIGELGESFQTENQEIWLMAFRFVVKVKAFDVSVEEVRGGQAVYHFMSALGDSP